MFKWHLVKAKSIMTKEIITVRNDSEIREAMYILVKKQISGLPVVDSKMQLVGIVSEKDILRLLFSGGQEGKTVADCMTKNVISFGPDESVVNVCAFFITNPYRRVPIVDNGKLVGVLARRDVISLLLASNSEKK